MDVSAFYEDNFNTVTWINDILKNINSEENKEQYTASLVKKLQLYVQEVNSALEDTSQQVLLSLPRIMKDTRSLQQEAMVLKEKMVSVKEEIGKVEKDTGQSMAALERLDSLRTKLMEAKQGLNEADNWTLLANELEEAFESSNIELISSKIVSMQQSLKMLVNISDYEEKKLQLEQHKNQLEAMTSPNIVQAFTSGNIEQSIVYAKIFASIDRTPQLIKYYHKCQKGSLLQKWRNQIEIELDETVAQWIHNFYDVLLSNWHGQIKWFNSVFPSHGVIPVLIEIYTDLLSSLDPSLNQCIDAALKQQNDKLSLLLELKQITKQFANNLFNLIENQGKTPKEKNLALCQAIYSPYITYIQNYAAYEQAYLIQKVTSLNLLKDDYQETVQGLGLATPVILDLGTEAQKRCKEFTENTGLNGLFIALRAFFHHFLDQFRVVLRQIDRARNGKEEDWSTFQICLTILQNLGDITLNLQNFEKELTITSLVVLKGHNFDYKLLLLSENAQKDYENLVQNIKEGRELSILESVNSELQKLCVDVHHMTYKVIITPILHQLETVQNSKAWLDSDNSMLPSVDLPDYSFAPQEYITQIGQYLMTLPQHLEPFLLEENPNLGAALKLADQTYMEVVSGEGGGQGGLADALLAIVAKGTCRAYIDTLLAIRQLRNSACRQLAIDIEYLGNILDDLGLSLSDSLQQILTLLRLPAENYATQSSGCAPRLVAAVRQMRNITST